MDLETLGWNSFFAEAFAPHAAAGWVPARVIEEQRGHYRVQSESGEFLAEVTGKLRHGAASRQDLPAVGDWVAVPEASGSDRLAIQAVLPRKSRFSRKVAGDRTEEQVVAVNIDTVFLMTGLDGDFNVRRIERYLTAAYNSGADPVVLLNKADLCEEPDAAIEQVEEVAMGVPVHAISALEGAGLDVLEPYLQAGRTVSFLGSSGVGKSTLVNQLLGRGAQEVKEVREGDNRGRHTTTHRELFILEGGGLLIDTPGMRELQLWEGGEGLETVFEEIQELSEKCRFRDCQHAGEPGCAIQEAIDRGDLSAERLESYHKLQSELRYLERRQDGAAQQEEKKRIKKLLRSFYRQQRKG